MPTTNGGLNFTYPTEGATGWYSTAQTMFNAISAHDHTASNKGGLITTAAITADSVTQDKIQLDNNTSLNWLDSTAASIGAIKVNASDQVQVLLETVFDSNVAVTGNMAVTGTLDVTETTTVDDLTVEGALTLDNVLTVPNGGTGLTTVTTGDLLYASDTDTFSALAAGTEGEILVQGATSPMWQGLGQRAVKLITAIVDNDVSVSFTTGLDSTYSRYLVTLRDVYIETSNKYLALALSSDGGSNWNSLAYCASSLNQTGSQGTITTLYSSSAATIYLSNSTINAASPVYSDIYIDSLVDDNNNGTFKMTVDTRFNSTSNGYVRMQGSGWANVGIGTPINAIKILANSGNILSGTITLYGLVE